MYITHNAKSLEFVRELGQCFASQMFCGNRYHALAHCAISLSYQQLTFLLSTLSCTPTDVYIVGHVARWYMIDNSVGDCLFHDLTWNALTIATACCMHGLPMVQIAKLQRVQNVAARLIMNLEKYSSISPALYELHWLPQLTHGFILRY